MLFGCRRLLLPGSFFLLLLFRNRRNLLIPAQFRLLLGDWAWPRGTCYVFLLSTTGQQQQRKAE